MHIENKGLRFWQIVFLLTVISGVIAEAITRVRGLPDVANADFPLDLSACVVFCGLSLTAGGFVIAAVLAVLEVSQYQTLRRMSLVLGYIGFIGALSMTAIHYRFAWPALWSLWSPKSLPVGAGLALILYSFVVAESVLTEDIRGKFGFLEKRSFRYTIMLLTSIAAFVAGLQQTAFLNIMVVAPQQFSAIWVSSMLPVNLFLSNVAGTIAVIIFAIWRLERVHEGYTPTLIYDTSVVALRVTLILLIGIRFLDLTDVHQWYHLSEGRLNDYLFGLELVLFFVPALFLLNLRQHERRLAFDCAVMVIAGFLANRLNTAITSREVVTGLSFVPSVRDALVSAAIVASSIAGFAWIANRGTFGATRDPNRIELGFSA